MLPHSYNNCLSPQTDQFCGSYTPMRVLAWHANEAVLASHPL